MPKGRRGTRINCKIPLIIAGLDASRPFSEPGTAILVNPQGCAARFGRPLDIGDAVQLQGLPGGNNVTARVVNCISLGPHERLWIIGLALDEPGNVWGITTPPEDWHIEPASMETEKRGTELHSTDQSAASPNFVGWRTENTVITNSATLCHSQTPVLRSPKAADLPRDKSSTFARPLILCLEDDESYLRLRKAVLEKEGYNVIGVRDAKDALNTFREAPVCLVLADHMLRGTRGTTLAGQMKRVKPDVPVVLYSGKQPETLANVDVFINKDASTQDFLSLVRDIMKRYSS